MATSSNGIFFFVFLGRSSRVSRSQDELDGVLLLGGLRGGGHGVGLDHLPPAPQPPAPPAPALPALAAPPPPVAAAAGRGTVQRRGLRGSGEDAVFISVL